MIDNEYNNLDKEIVYKTVGDAINQYSRYCDYVFEFSSKF